MIYGALCISGVWRSGDNSEVEELHNDASVVLKNKAHRLRCFGHLYRMDDTSHGGKCIFSKPQGRLR